MVRCEGWPSKVRTRARIATCRAGGAPAVSRASMLTMSKSWTMPSVFGLQDTVASLASTVVSYTRQA